MVAVVKVNTQGLQKKLRVLREGADNAALAVAKDGADKFVGFMVDHAKRDTGRYVNGWVKAGNAAGLPQRRAVILRESRWKEKFSKALDAQIDRFIKRIETLQGILDAWYYTPGRPLNKWGRKKRAEINRLTKKLVRAVDQKRRYLNAEGPVLVVDLFSNGRTVLTTGGKYRNLRLTTVRDKVYGGSGEIITREGEMRVVLHNREPHVSIVERRYRFVRRAKGFVRKYSQAQAKRVYLQELRRNTNIIS